MPNVQLTFLVHVCVCHVHEYQDMHTCVCVCACMCMYICSWQSEIDAKDLSQSLLHLHSSRQLSLKLESTSWLDWPESSSSSCLCLASTDSHPCPFSHIGTGDPKAGPPGFSLSVGYLPRPLSVTLLNWGVLWRVIVSLKGLAYFLLLNRNRWRL